MTITQNTKNILNKNIDSYKTNMLKEWEELPIIFITTAEKKTGHEDSNDSSSQIDLANSSSLWLIPRQGVRRKRQKCLSAAQKIFCRSP